MGIIEIVFVTFCLDLLWDSCGSNVSHIPPCCQRQLSKETKDDIIYEGHGIKASHGYTFVKVGVFLPESVQY